MIVWVVVLRTVPRKLAVVFYAIHTLAYFTTGRLLPYYLFDLMQRGIVAGIYYAETFIIAGLMTSHAITMEVGAFFTHVVTGSRTIAAADDAGAGRTSGLMMESKGLNGTAMDADAVAWERSKQWANGLAASWYASLLKMMFLVLAGAWSYIMKLICKSSQYYYTLILAWGAIRGYEGVFTSVQLFLAKSIGYGFLEYSGEG
ncbi:hypothetical protein HK101_010146 [Irineochytrium annulatum]|nr:hypothetical protein HK101_010146 [Irineochytrium annulatum]